MKLLEVIGLVGDMRDITGESDDIARDLDRMQSAAHRILAAVEAREEIIAH